MTDIEQKALALVDAIKECDDGAYCETVAEYAELILAALEARGLEIRSKNDDR